MSKAWDILPPRRKLTKSERKEAKKKSKGLSGFLTILFLIVIGFIYYGANKSLTTGTPATAPTAKSTPTEKPTPAPVNNSQTKDKKDLNIKLLNGSGQSEELTTAYKLLEDTGFKAQKTENTLNLYEQSIIYYQPSEEKHALEIAEVLKKYQIKIQKFSQETSYDLIIVIGPR